MGLDAPGGGGDSGMLDGVKACATLPQQASVFHGHGVPVGRAAGVQQMLWIVAWLGPEGQECLSAHPRVGEH